MSQSHKVDGEEGLGQQSNAISFEITMANEDGWWDMRRDNEDYAAARARWRHPPVSVAQMYVLTDY
jgi:hypothetical protein